MWAPDRFNPLPPRGGGEAASAGNRPGWKGLEQNSKVAPDRPCHFYFITGHWSGSMADSGNPGLLSAFQPALWNETHYTG
ncbi:hypothetical protein AAFF_G00053310 [Aldrovandia affinis]|uniref:Uncharacterized protein n=1 Tax=Aldrovandia affinis TaxID=143900 RepID=A0AAD7WYJ7_9TELE|nr:hypothetical protein AAFF_G00053310 [Aldrovandia affinis]